jgi:nitrate reductase NapA
VLGEIKRNHNSSVSSVSKYRKVVSFVTEAMAEMHADDARKLGVKTGDSVRITSRRGQEVFHAKVTDNSQPGLIFVHMHDADRMCNRVTIDAVDPISKEPEFKICAVRVNKA